MSEKFKVGDKVIAKPKNDYGITTNGWQGVVTETAENWFSAKGKDTLGRDYVFTRLMYSGFDLAKERIEQEKIVIVTDGRNTTAMMYKDGKKVRTSMSKCSPDDKFDFATGARIAFERLIGDSEKEPEKDLRGLLIDGVFGKSDKYGVFVVSGDKLIFRDNGYNFVSDYNRGLIIEDDDKIVVLYTGE